MEYYYQTRLAGSLITRLLGGSEGRRGDNTLQNSNQLVFYMSRERFLTLLDVLRLVVTGGSILLFYFIFESSHKFSGFAALPSLRACHAGGSNFAVLFLESFVAGRKDLFCDVLSTMHPIVPSIQPIAPIECPRKSNLLDVQLVNL